MPLNVGIIDPSIVTQGTRESKIDLATPVNMYTALRADSRAQKLSELTLSKEEKAAKREEDLQGIIKSSLTPDGHIDSEKALASLNRGGFVDEAAHIQERMEKARMAQQTAMQEAQKAKQEMQKRAGNAALAVIDSKDKPSAFLQFQKFANENQLPISDDVKNYRLADDEAMTGNLHPKILSYLDYLGNESLSPEDRLKRMKETNPEKALSPKDQLDENRRKEGEALSEEFRTLMLPQLSIKDLSTNKNARNELVKTINASKYWNTPLAKQVMEGLKGQSSSLAEDLAGVLSKQNISDTKLTQDEEKGLGAVQSAVSDMNKLVDMYQAGDTGTIGSSIEDKASRLPIIGQRFFKGPAEFGKHKDIMAERFLRAATGAAAPPSEVATYRGFLPEWGDTPAQAQVAQKAFMDNVKAKADQSVSRLRLLGTKESLAKAQEIETNISTIMNAVKPIEITIGKWKKVN